ncbi:Sporulation-regulated protein 28 [Nakaseomyces bracarensis]|uniref:Sporulation-regulated protein 28 n=1 Tax=Nakaseomyces bracarensis TaxID=273131 RepID=A0ABR4P062_9SACH
MVIVDTHSRSSRPMSSHTVNVIELRRNKCAKKPIQLCLLILGERGSGKSTFINNLCSGKLFNEERNILEDPKYAHLPPKLQLVKKHLDLSNDELAPVLLDLVTFEGFGDGFNNENTSYIINEYLESQFDMFIEDEEQVQRKTKTHDTRPHACIYFIKPNLRGLKEFDVDILKKICTKVNIIPVLGKADILSSRELEYNRQIIMRAFKEYNIKIFNFGEDKIGDIFTSIKDNYFLKVLRHMNINQVLPFAISCCNLEHKPDNSNNETLHIREYYWGKLIVENVRCSDFVILKGLLFGSHIQDLKDHTHNVLYETYRTIKLLELRSNKIANKVVSTSLNEPKALFGLEFEQNDPIKISSQIHKEGENIAVIQFKKQNQK